MASDKDIKFSPREMEVLALSWQCMDSQPKIDMQKLARLTGYTPGSASVTFGCIKKKIRLLGESLSENGPATPKKNGSPGRSKTTNVGTPKPASKRSANANDAPSKRRKKGGRQQREESNNDKDEEDFAGMTIKKEEPADGDNEHVGHEFLKGVGEYSGDTQAYGEDEEEHRHT